MYFDVVFSVILVLTVSSASRISRFIIFIRWKMYLPPNSSITVSESLPHLRTLNCVNLCLQEAIPGFTDGSFCLFICLFFSACFILYSFWCCVSMITNLLFLQIQTWHVSHSVHFKYQTLSLLALDAQSGSFFLKIYLSYLPLTSSTCGRTQLKYLLKSPWLLILTCLSFLHQF